MSHGLIFSIKSCYEVNSLAMDGGSQNGKQRALRAGRSQNEFSAHPSPSPHSELLARVWL